MSVLVKVAIVTLCITWLMILWYVLRGRFSNTNSSKEK
jgi:nitrogen fixation-related uncharacterized protein